MMPDLLGALIFIALFHPTIRYLHEPTATDIVLFGIYFACAVTTMVCSAVFHLFNCTSPGAYKRLATLDYSGISLLIVGSYLPLVYWYAFLTAPFTFHEQGLDSC